MRLPQAQLRGLAPAPAAAEAQARALGDCGDTTMPGGLQLPTWGWMGWWKKEPLDNHMLTL